MDAMGTWWGSTPARRAERSAPGGILPRSCALIREGTIIVESAIVESVHVAPPAPTVRTRRAGRHARAAAFVVTA
ncbi:hypothetical protein [Frankia sp. AgB32]|uniref:hypothetical protein n=1 Tax=Frankia sp. AgB32 TaxID=631119 RepID=UPI00200F8882|nr:hypothetical protein [Frankia sp. AgB32]MCK9894665.1 hypothetical protein [Frankia sp. AgB32]